MADAAADQAREHDPYHAPLAADADGTAFAEADALAADGAESEADERGRLAAVLSARLSLAELRALAASRAAGPRRLELDAQSRDWNREFQELVDELRHDESILDQEQRFARLSRLARDFRSTAELLGKLIISERHLARKTIAPLEGVGGVAGGVKYLSHNILFKFPVERRDLGLDEEGAFKTAGHELRGFGAVYRALGPDIDVRVPLSCLVEYRGYRLLAMSLLPIGPETLLHGSSDAARTFSRDSEGALSGMLAQLATVLNLREHSVRDAQGAAQQVALAFDTEGHRGRDYRYYLIDLHRLFPPEPVWRQRAGDASPAAAARPEAGLMLVRMMRPELVRASDRPLVNDVFVCDAEQKRDLEEAHRRLIDTVIPEFARALDSKDRSSDEFQHLTSYLHQAGINVRHLGRVRAHLRAQEWRDLALVEMVARTLKNLLRRDMRRSMATLDNLSAERFRLLSIEAANRAFAPSRAQAEFWREELMSELERRFPEGLARAEREDLRAAAEPLMPAIFVKFVEYAGLVLDRNLVARLRAVLDSLAAPLLAATAEGSESARAVAATPAAGASTVPVAAAAAAAASSHDFDWDGEEKAKGASTTPLPHPRRSKSGSASRASPSPAARANPLVAGRVFARGTSRNGLPGAHTVVPAAAHGAGAIGNGGDCDESANVGSNAERKSAELTAAAQWRALWPLEEVHVTDIVERVKEMNIVPYAEGTVLFIRSRRKKRGQTARQREAEAEARVLEAEAHHSAELARERFEEALRCNRNDWATLCNYGFLMDAVFSDRVGALRLYEASLRANPLHVRSWYYLALMHMQMNAFDEAERAFRRAIEVSRGAHANSLKDFGRMLMQLGRAEEAQAYVQRALVVCPVHTRSLHLLMLWRLRAGRYEEALELALRAARSGQGDADTRRDGQRKFVSLARARARIEVLIAQGKLRRHRTDPAAGEPPARSIARARELLQTAMTVWPRCVALLLEYALLLDEHFGESAVECEFAFLRAVEVATEVLTAPVPWVTASAAAADDGPASSSALAEVEQAQSRAALPLRLGRAASDAVSSPLSNGADAMRNVMEPGLLMRSSSAPAAEPSIEAVRAARAQLRDALESVAAAAARPGSATEAKFRMTAAEEALSVGAFFADFLLRRRAATRGDVAREWLVAIVSEWRRGRPLYSAALAQLANAAARGGLPEAEAVRNAVPAVLKRGRVDTRPWILAAQGPFANSVEVDTDSPDRQDIMALVHAMLYNDEAAASKSEQGRTDPDRGGGDEGPDASRQGRGARKGGTRGTRYHASGVRRQPSQ